MLATSPGSWLRRFLALEAAGGIVLFIAACIALGVANSPVAPLYTQLLKLPLSLRFGALAIDKPLLLWVNDGLMAIFFMLVGLEVKREVLEGELSSLSNAALPAIAALGGMAMPAAVYIG
ncbi:MAG: Na+/H+ antiporter NhaA, partial [Stellaceae bacterium]